MKLEILPVIPISILEKAYFFLKATSTLKMAKRFWSSNEFTIFLFSLATKYINSGYVHLAGIKSQWNDISNL